jgi:hypothetical protein
MRKIPAISGATRHYSSYENYNFQNAMTRLQVWYNTKEHPALEAAT